MAMPPFAELVRMRLVHRVPGMESVPPRRELAYKELGETRLLADLYRPPDEEPRPAVILIHGGPVPSGSGPKNMGIYQSLGELLAASGLAAIAFNHRFHGPELLVEAAGDVRDLVRWARASASSLGVDADRLALWAFSGGGPFLSGALREAPDYLRCIVAYYAVLDLQERPPGASDSLTDETRRAYSPAQHVATAQGPLPPMLIARAGLDQPWLNGSIDRFVQEALRQNAPLDLLNHPQGRHGFDILDDVPRTHEIIENTLSFLKRHLA